MGATPGIGGQGAAGDGSVSLRAWLANTEMLAGPRVEAAVFKRLRAKVEGRSVAAKTSLSPPLINEPGDGHQRFVAPPKILRRPLLPLVPDLLRSEELFTGTVRSSVEVTGGPPMVSIPSAQVRRPHVDESAGLPQRFGRGM